jgi:hypothetical protein
MNQSEPKTSPTNITVNLLYECPSRLVMWFQSPDMNGRSRTVICPSRVPCFMHVLVHVDHLIIL